MDNEDGELGGLAELLTLSLVGDLGKLLLNVLLELADGVDEGGAGVVNLVNDKNTAAEETAVLELVAESREVDPLDSDDLGAGNLLDLGKLERSRTQYREWGRESQRIFPESHRYDR